MNIITSENANLLFIFTYLTFITYQKSFHVYTKTMLTSYIHTI